MLSQVRQSLAARIAALLAALSAGRSNLPKQPREYQKQAFQALLDWLLSDDQSDRAYITHATGLGKTVFFSALIRYCIGLRCLIVVPSKILVGQTAKVVQSFTGGIIGHLSSLGDIANDAGEIVAVRGTDFSDVVVATDESLIRHADKLSTEFSPHLLIWDECHTAYTRCAKESLDRFHGSVILGMSATPDYLVVEKRKDHIPVAMENGQTLYVHPNRMASTHFNREIHALHTTWGINNGWLAPLAAGFVEFDVDLDQVPLEKTEAGWDYNKGALYDAMADHWPLMIETVTSIYKRNEPFAVRGRRAYALCPRVREANELAEALNGAGIDAACITGKTKDDDRDKLLQAYQHHDIQFLSSVMVLREGWDAPEAEVCWMLRPTQSRVLYVQGMGRVLRISDTNPDKVALVIDPLFQGNRHAPLSAPALFGTPGQEHASGDLLIPGKWRGTRGQKSSPYLPKGVRPKLFVVSVPVNAPTRDFYETIEEAADAARKLGAHSQQTYLEKGKQDPKLPRHPEQVYKDQWKGWPEFLAKPTKSLYETVEEASKAARKLGFTTSTQYHENYTKDPRLPAHPYEVYGQAWVDMGRWSGFLGVRNQRERADCYPTLKEASEAAKHLGITSSTEYQEKYKTDPRLPAAPERVYGKAWIEVGGWPGFLGQTPRGKAGWYQTIQEAAIAARKLGISNRDQYNKNYTKDPRLPSNPDKAYGPDAWKEIGGFSGFLGVQGKRSKSDCYQTLEEAAQATRKLGIENQIEYRKRYKEDSRLPASPREFYGEAVWTQNGGWPGLFGEHKTRSKDLCYPTIEEAAKAARKLGIKSISEYNRLYRNDPKLPSAPQKAYKDGWERMGRWPGFLGKKTD